MKRPYISFNNLERPFDEEHYDVVHLLVIDVMRRVTGELSRSVHQALRECESSAVQQAAQEVMNKAYFTSMDGNLRLMGPGEVAASLGVTPQQVHKLRRKEGFPSPVQELAMGPVWLAKDIEQYGETPRKPGRPPKESKGESNGSKAPEAE